MGTVWVTCPVTGQKAFTGIETNQTSFDLIPGDQPFDCPVCGDRHAGIKTHATFEASTAEMAGPLLLPGRGVGHARPSTRTRPGRHHVQGK
jgi:hypothetical protein